MAALGAVGLGACAVLAACSPVQMGSAAIVGNQRITVASLDSDVSNLQASVQQYNSDLQELNAEAEQEEEELPVYAAPLSRVVLNWQITFAIMERAAANHGISVTQAQGVAALSDQAKADDVSTNVFLTAVGIPLQMSEQAGDYLAQGAALDSKFGSDSAGFTKAQCTAAQSLNIQVSPQFGRFDYASSALGLVAGNDTLSRPAGTPSPADTEGLTAAAC